MRPFFFGFFFSGGARDFLPPPTTTPKFISERRHNRGSPSRKPAQETIEGLVFHADTLRNAFDVILLIFWDFFFFFWFMAKILEIQCFT